MQPDQLGNDYLALMQDMGKKFMQQQQELMERMQQQQQQKQQERQLQQLQRIQEQNPQWQMSPMMQPQPVASPAYYTAGAAQGAAYYPATVPAKPAIPVGTAGVYQPGYAAMEQQSMMTQNYAAGAAQGMGTYSAATPAMQAV